MTYCYAMAVEGLEKRGKIADDISYLQIFRGMQEQSDKLFSGMFSMVAEDQRQVISLSFSDEVANPGDTSFVTGAHLQGKEKAELKDKPKRRTDKQKGCGMC